MAIFNGQEVSAVEDVNEALAELQAEVNTNSELQAAIVRGNAAAQELVNIVTQNQTATNSAVEAAAEDENFAIEAEVTATVTHHEPIRLVENGIYIVQMRNDDVRNVGVFTGGMFELAGWEIMVTTNDVIIVESLGVL